METKGEKKSNHATGFSFNLSYMTFSLMVKNLFKWHFRQMVISHGGTVA